MTLGFQGADFAIAAIDINPKDVEVRTFDSRFSTMPTNFSDFNPDRKDIEVCVTNMQSNKFFIHGEVKIELSNQIFSLIINDLFLKASKIFYSITSISYF